jgi:hypothetical protein
MHIFISGVMQANRLDDQIEDQNYRVTISRLLQKHLPDVTITDPWALHPDSVNYDSQTAQDTFLSMAKQAGTADLLIAYLPQPSMGTAIEMWEASQAGAYVIAITRLKYHWAVRFTADEIVPDLKGFISLVENGRLVNQIIPKILTRRES